MEFIKNLQPDLALTDGIARLDAINPTQSFIVQAPAGSGKTALLTQRFLALLALVEQPENIVAMTFTKKAAAEMRERIIEALVAGTKQLDADADTYQRNTHILAQAALARNDQQNWQLLQNPNRLRIRTIDSMNTYLVQNMPFLSRLGAQPGLDADGDELYAQAARAVLASNEAQQAVGVLLPILNGSYSRAEEMLINMLKKRDQWLRHTAGASLERKTLEGVLADLLEAEFEQVLVQLNPVFALLQQLPEFARFVAETQPHLVPDLIKIDSLKPVAEQLAAWNQAVDMLLTREGLIRKAGGINARNGFPTSDKAKKAEFIDLLEEISRIADSYPEVVDALKAVKTLPNPTYSDEQWQALEAILNLLKLSAAFLKLTFQQHGKADFIEIAQAADRALGTELEPTDFAQKLDYQLQHLLIDEFQDTSVGQFQLLEKLVAGWQKGDGKTLFLVGDPMQSIYRFREAEVGNFMQVWDSKSVADVAVEPINLIVNFRSSEPLVNWFNQVFAQVFPAENNLLLGAVKYTNAEAIKPATRPGCAVISHFSLNKTRVEAGQEIVELIKTKLAEYEQNAEHSKSIALLGRSRAHLVGLAQELSKQQIPFRAVELEVLAARQEIQDALALTRALWHQEDRGAWLALLRAPFIGLSLADLYQLTSAEDAHLFQAVPSLLARAAENDFAGLSADGKERCNQAWLQLAPALELVGRLPLSRLVHQTWLQLGAASALPTEVEQKNLQVFFKGLQEFDKKAFDIKQLEAWVENLYAAGDSSEAAQKVQLMTMHKSKGLQFDTVILPSLAARGRPDDAELFSWMRFIDAKGKAEREKIVFAPLALNEADKNQGINGLMKSVDRQKSRFEMMRLLYVAATRAEAELHLFAEMNYSLQNHEKDIVLQPDSNSLLSVLWPAVLQDFEALREPAAEVLLAQEEAEKSAQTEQDILVSRLNNQGFDFNQFAGKQEFEKKLTASQEVKQQEANELPASRSLQISVAPRLVGDLVHAVLEQLARQGIENWDADKIASKQASYQAWLQQKGLAGEELTHSVQRVVQNLQNALNNQQIRWALSLEREEAECEKALTSSFDSIENHIIDRTFIAENQRWIVDYKTAQTPAGDRAEFLAEQIEIYRPQLERYGKLFAELEDLPQRKVLYFSDLDEWVEV